MEVVKKDSKLWEYLHEEIRGLVTDGEKLLINCHTLEGNVSDYSYLVFPFAKAYEGFLKRFFLDLELIREEEFYGEDIRIGRILNPLFKKKGFSVYSKLAKHKSYNEKDAEKLWKIWKRGRNKVFHYFPHNFRRLSQEEALNIIEEFVSAMETAVSLLPR